MERARDRFGRMDSLINNAGIFIGKPFTDYTADDYDLMTTVNLAGFFHITQRAIRQMVRQGGGHVVNVSTSLVDHARSDRPAALSRPHQGWAGRSRPSLAIEYASRGVRVNAVALGVIKTPMHDPATYDGMAAFHPLGRRARSATSSTGSSTSNGPPSSPARSSTSMAVRPPDTDTGHSRRPASPAASSIDGGADFCGDTRQKPIEPGTDKAAISQKVPRPVRARR